MAELTLQLERVICLGSDGHAGFPELLRRARHGEKEMNPAFILEPCGDRYLVYRPEHVDPAGRLQPRINYRFVLLKDGYPFLDGSGNLAAVLAADRAFPALANINNILAHRWREGAERGR